MIAALGTTPLMLAVIVGTIQNIMSKSAKYSLFDPTKEMAYIPLDQEQKSKGKAAIDVVGARLGKSGGSFDPTGTSRCVWIDQCDHSIPCSGPYCDHLCLDYSC